jgi:hypothetical protein
MALTVLTDVIVPSVFANYVQNLTSQRSAFVQSGVLAGSPAFDALLAGGGRTFDLPYFNDLDDTESGVSADTGAAATPGNITASKEVAIRLSRNRSWGSADLVAELAGADPMIAIANRVADYWVRQLQRIVIAAVQGVVADNVANDAGDMVKNVAIGASGTPTAANKFSTEAFMDTVQTMGDAGENLVAVAMHSVVYTQANKNNLIDFIPDSEGRPVRSFLGRRVIVDDGLPVVTNGSNLEYSTYLFGLGALARGVGQPRVPVEPERSALARNGGGEETLTSRVTWLVHPRGTKFLSGSMAGQSPANTELKAAANWDRVFERKLVRLAELRTNG